MVGNKRKKEGKRKREKERKKPDEVDVLYVVGDQYIQGLVTQAHLSMSAPATASHPVTSQQNQWFQR